MIVNIGTRNNERQPAHLLRTASVGGLMFNTLKSAMNRVSTAFRPPPWGPMAPMYRMSLRVCTVEVKRVRVRVGVVAGVRERVGVKVRGIVRVRGRIKE